MSKSKWMDRSLAFGLVAAVSLGALVACGDDAEGFDCSGDVPTYASLREAFDVSCAGCHEPNSQEPGIPPSDYTNYQGVRGDAQLIAQRVEDGSMPPQGSPRLSEREATDMIKWGYCGAPE